MLNSCSDRESRFRAYGILIWWNNMWGFRVISSSNRWWTSGRCGHICRPCRLRLNVVNGALIWSSQSTVADNVVIAVSNSRVEVVEERINFEVAINRNLDMQYYSELRRQGIEVDDNNDPAPKNTPKMNNKTTNSETALNWNGAEGILCPILSGNLPDTPACV